MRRHHIGSLFLAVALLCAAGPALAHKIKVFATAEGARIDGYVYFPGGGRATGATVAVLGPDGDALGTLTTDAEGAFTFTAARRVDHTFEVDTGDGHHGSFTVKAAQLPAALPGTGETAAPGALTGEFSRPAAEPSLSSGLDPTVLEDAIARAVAREVNPLRQQIEAYEERIRIHDILGGLGWIAGLAGLGVLVLRRR